MSDPFNGDDDVLGRLVREAGDPSVVPDAEYAERLRGAILGRVHLAEAAADERAAVREAEAISPWILKRNRTMQRILKLALAATILVAVGLVVFWQTLGGSAGIAFADVAKALDSLRSATFDVTTEATAENGQEAVKGTGKGFFLAPSRQRMEISVDVAAGAAAKTAAEATQRRMEADSPAVKAATEAAAKAAAQAAALMPKTMTTITITDSQTDKAVMLMPGMKMAVTMDMKKAREAMKKSAGGPPSDLFEMVRRIVREGSAGSGEKPKPLGKKEIDGREAVGFSVHNAMNGMGDMTLWADPQTAQPIRVELVGELGAKIRMVMDNFRYDVALDPSLFTLEPPTDYATQTVEVTLPTEEDLLRTLRTVAEHRDGMFPSRLAMTKEIMGSVWVKEGPWPEVDQATQAKLEAALNEIVAKHGGREKLREKYGAQLPPEIMAEYMKATMPIVQEQTQKQMREQVPRTGRELQGIQFYTSLTSENDPHYVGDGVKLGTPDRPILWYKPTGATKYRVVYADLGVKELTSEEVKQLPEAKANE